MSRNVHGLPSVARALSSGTQAPSWAGSVSTAHDEYKHCQWALRSGLTTAIFNLCARALRGAIEVPFPTGNRSCWALLGIRLLQG